MARARDPNRDKAFEIYKQHNGDITNRAIAEQLNVPEKTISAWKSRDKWIAVLQNNECSTTEKQCSTTNGEAEDIILTDADREPPKQDNKAKKRSGNPNPKNQFTNRNTMSVKHGFYRQFLPIDMLEIIEETQDLTIADRLYFQIETKFAALIQLHKIMFVENKNDTLNDLDMVSSGENGNMNRYKVVYAFEQYAEYIKTEARLTAEWRNVVKQYLELADEYDERRMKIEQMQLNIEKTKTDIARNQIAIEKEIGVTEEYEDDGFIDALKGVEVDWNE